MLYSFLLEIQHNCPFSKFSRNHPEIEINLWCNNGHHDILELTGESHALEQAIVDLETELGTITSIFPERNHVQLVFNLCKCNEFPLNPIFNRYDCLELPPVRYFSGRELMNLLVTAEDAGLILEDIRKEDSTTSVKVLKLAPLKNAGNLYPLFLPLDDLKKNLTTKQLQALSTAYNKGYYELPRMVFLEKLAEEMEIHRRTYEEHLRKAEKKIMSVLIPSLSLYEKT
ncbi:MAG: helix-turn-helix domain-containing protein [Candidatus Hodarchaeales archaeon]